MSDAWFDATEVIAAKYANQLPDLGERAKVNMVVTGTPFGAEPVRTSLDTSTGQLLVARGAIDKPDCTVTTDYATCTTLLMERDENALMGAFFAGKIKVQGDLAKLLTMMTAVQNAPASDAATAAAEEVRAITELQTS